MARPRGSPSPILSGIRFRISRAMSPSSARPSAIPAVYGSYASDLFPKALNEYHELFLVDCPDFREFLAFAVSCYSALNVARDLGHEQFQHFRMETITSDSSALDRFCRTLTGLDYDMDQLQSFVAAGAINRHRKNSSSTEPAAIYRMWPAWKRDIAAVMISAQALARFEGAGYEVDMLRDGSHETEGERTVVPCLADALRAMDERHPLLAPLSGGVTTARGPAYVAEPVLLESLAGYNILQVRTEFLALEQSLGAVDLTLDSQELIARHGFERVLVARTLEEAREQRWRFSLLAALRSRGFWKVSCRILTSSNSELSLSP